MGLLDFLNSDMFSQKEQPANAFQPGYANALIGLGTGLLGSGGYSTTPMSGGQAFAQGLQGLQQGMAQDRAQALQGFQVQHLNSQMDIEKQRAELLKSQVQAQLRNQAIINGILSGQGLPATSQATPATPEQQLAGNFAAGSPGPRQVPAAQNSSSAASSMAGGFNPANLTLGQLAGLKMAGVDITDIYKLATEPKEFKPNSFYQSAQTGKLSYVPDVANKGISFDVNTGNVSLLPGFAAATAAVEGAKTTASETAKAALDPVSLFNPATQRNEMVPRLTAMRGAQGTGGGVGPSGGLATGPSAAEESFGRSTGTARSDVFQRSLTNAQAATNTLQSLDSQLGLINNAFQPGALADVKAGAAKWLQGLGVSEAASKSLTGGDSAAFRLFQSNANEQVQAIAKTLGANPTDNDARLLANTIAQATDPKEAALAIIDYQRKKSLETIQRHNRLHDWTFNQGKDPLQFESDYVLNRANASKANNPPPPPPGFSVGK